MNAEMNPEKMAELSEEEQEAANLYRDFFQRNGMLGDAGSRPGFTPGVKNSEETMPYRKYTGGGRPTEVDPARMSEDESLGMLYDTIKRHESAGDMDPEQLSDLKRQFAQRRSRQMSGGGGEVKKKKRFQFWKK
ncbi:MAG: hypothetical protein LUB63_03595 [Oscillospiraceae bacterium]|nr:hypothetical protein [Oscillospiraceae bacterium]